MLKVLLTRDDKETGAWLWLPSTPANIGAAYAALDNINGTENLDTRITGVESSIPNLRQYLIGKSTDDPKTVKELDFIAQRIDGFTESESIIFSGALDIESINTLADIINLTYSLEGYELYPDVSTSKELGRHLVESGEVYIHESALPYVDYERVATEYEANNSGTYTAAGYVAKIGGSIEHIYDGITLPDLNAGIHTVKFYSPLFIKTCEPHSYDMSELPSANALAYTDKILTTIEKEKLPCEGRKGLMTYFDGDEALAQKVHSANPTVEEYKGELWGVMVTEVSGELTESEIATLTDYFTGQYSDGWGEGLEQREISTADSDIYVSFWDYNGYFIKPEQEFKRDMGQETNSGIHKMSC